MQVILGAGGPVANALTRLIEADHLPLRLASRRPIQTSAKLTTWQKTDLVNPADVDAACTGATVIYLTAGLVYDARIWAKQWPVIMDNVIAAAKKHNARLLFFDNLYMYGLVNGAMTEKTPNNPMSEKGRVRAAIAEKLMHEISSGKVKGSIARAADFYGSETGNSFLEMMVLGNFAKGKKAMWMGDPEKLHNYTYVPDAARGFYLLGKTPGSDGEIWHLPTPEPVTGKAILALASRIYGTKNSYTRLPKFFFRVMGLFQRFMKEMVEMFYQVEHDYVFDSSKFEKTFGLKPTSYEQGFREISERLIPKR